LVSILATFRMGLRLPEVCQKVDLRMGFDIIWGFRFFTHDCNPSKILATFDVIDTTHFEIKTRLGQS